MKTFSKLAWIVLLAFSVSSFSQSYEADFQSRSQQIINYVADDYKADASGWYDCNPSDYGKYNWQIVVACFQKYGLTNVKGNSYLPHFNTPTCINNRYHFNLVGETFIFSHYWGAPSVKENIKSYLTAAWNRTDSYNLFTCEGTENHIAMTRPAAYLYAEIARDSFPADFPDAQLKLTTAKKWITDWAKMLYASGPGEWNSSTYAQYSIIGWLALYDNAKDAEVRNVAHAVLDYYACEMALHYTQGIVGGYESRNGTGYQSVVTGSDYFSWLWFGDSPRKISWTVNSQNMEASTAVYAAVSSYRPPLVAVQLAKKQLTTNAMYYNSKGEYLMNNPGAIKQTFYIGKTYTLGAAYLPYGGFTGGDAQFQAWKFVGKVTPDDTNASKTANVIVGYGSKEWNKARNRMPWDQLVHHKNVLVQMTKVPLNFTTITTQIQDIITQWQSNWKSDFDQRFPLEGKVNPVNYSADVLNANFSYMAIWKKNSTVSTVVNSNIVFYEMDSNYVSIRSIAQSAPTVIAPATDNYALKDAAPQGSLCGLILEVGSKKDYSSFANFQTAIISNSSLNKTNIATDKIIYTSAMGDVLSIQYNSSGTFTEPAYDWNYGPTTPQLAPTCPPFIQPTWPTGEGHGRNATWTVNGAPVNLAGDWGVYQGPHFSLSQSILRLNNGMGDTLRIDYTAALPVYNNESLSTALNSKNNMGRIRIYPNPVNEQLNVELISSYHGPYSIELLDLSGRTLIKINTEKKNELELAKLHIPERRQGVYIVKIKAGVNVYSEKIEIKK